MARRFALGRTVITANAQASLNSEDAVSCLNRHEQGDWGDLDDDDKDANAEALREGLRLLSAYTDRNGTRLWIITEWDRSVTTILLPEDY